MAVDYRDLALADLARSEVDARAGLVAYRELLQIAIAQLHDAHGEIARLREQHTRLLGEYRALREQIMLKDIAA